MHRQFTISLKKQFENSYSYLFLLYEDFIIIDKWFRLHIILKNLIKSGSRFYKSTI